MEVVVQSPSRSPTLDNFEFSGTMVSPYLSAPSSPKRLGEYYLSAPTSPSRISQLYGEFEYFSTTINNDSGSSSTIHFEAATNDDDDDDDGFAFYVSHESDRPSRSAEELFDGGKIKPLEPEGSQLFSTHHVAEEGYKVLKTFSPKSKKAQFQETEHRRGRDRTPASSVLSSSNSGRRVTRSHSPYRTSQYTWEAEEQQQQHHHHPRQQKPPLSNKEGPTLTSSSNSSKGSSRRWRLRDLLLFRSASEGRGSTFKSLLYNNRKHEEVSKTSSFRSSDSSSRRKGHVSSAHELHYAVKRAESEDMRKRTFLPYKQGILGRLAGLGL